MIRSLYTVRDIKAQTFCNPFASLNDMTARRDFAHAANDKTHPLGQNPGDYSLALIGTFDDESGEIVPMRPTFLNNASDFINPEKE